MVAVIKPLFPGFCSSTMIKMPPMSRTGVQVSDIHADDRLGITY